MAKYKVDKKLFEQKILEEQLKQIELQGKYLKDEPLKRSEVDEYNKLQASGWVRNTLITLGVIFSTAVAMVVFVLLGNMLMTNGRTGEIGKYDLDSSDVYKSFIESEEDKKSKGEEYFLTEPTPDERLESGEIVRYKDYPVPGNLLAESGGNEQDIVYITYRFVWDDRTSSWIVGRSDSETIGHLTQTVTERWNSDRYELDSKPIDLNTLMTNWFKGQEDGWAKIMIERWFYTAWPLTLVLWLVFFLAMVGYVVILVVGIRYVIRTVIGLLRKAGYIASDFVTEVVDAVKSEIPVVESEEVKELDFSEMKNLVEQQMKSEKKYFEVETESDPSPKLEEKPVVVNTKKQDPQTVVEEKPVVEKTRDTTSTEKTAKDKVLDIFE